MEKNSPNISAAIRTGIDMAMAARLVAALPDVELQNLDAERAQREQVGGAQCVVEAARHRHGRQQVALGAGRSQRRGLALQCG